MHQKISEAYTQNRLRLEARFPLASEFLLRIEARGAEHGLWLSTAQNAHVYREMMFLGYVGLRNPEQAPPSLYFSPQFHLRVADGSTDRTDLVFAGQLAAVVERYGGFAEGWAERDTRDAIEIHPGAPADFFDSLFDLFCSVGEGEPEVHNLAMLPLRGGERPRDLTLGIENFKGIRDRVSLQIRPITLLFGPNSAGKSTVLQALLYLHEILERGNVDAGTTSVGGRAVELGGFKNLVHGRDLGREVTLALNLGRAGFHLPRLGEPELSDVEPLDENPTGIGVVVRVGWSAFLDRPVVRMFEAEYDGVRVATVNASGQDVSLTVSVNPACRLFFGRGGGRWSLPEDPSPALTSLLSRPIPLRPSTFGALLTEDTLKSFEGRAEEFVRAGFGGFRERLEAVMLAITQRVRDYLSELVYVGPLRELPPRTYTPPRAPERGRWASGLAAWDLLHHCSEADVERVSAVLSSSLRTGYGLEVAQMLDAAEVDRALAEMVPGGDPVSALAGVRRERRVVLRQVGPHGVRVSPSDVGVGISQLLPVVVAATLDLVPKAWGIPPLVVIEQPELHLHPATQVELGDLFIQAACTGVEYREPYLEGGGQLGEAAPALQRTILLETHSEHLILRLLRRIEETTAGSLPNKFLALSPSDVAVYYVEQDEGRTLVQELRIDDEGEFLDPWPSGFFEERRRELF